jgi:hypothetical protein
MGGSRSNSSGAYMAMSGQRRIRTPHPHDVLSGRGGGINSHEGNKTFRSWVFERKERYNLAASKADKTDVANEVIELVRSLDPPGRFLQRDPSSTSSSSFWIELDEAKIMAKTSQALREGAPQIRAAHKEELASIRNKKKRRKASTKPASKKAATASSAASSSSSTNNMPAPIHGAPSLSSLQQHSPGKTLPLASVRARTDKALASLKQNVMEAQNLAEKQQQQQQQQQQQPDNSSILAPLSPFDFGTPGSAYGRPTKRIRHGESNFEPPTPPLTSVPHPPSLKHHSSSSSSNGLNGLLREHSLAMSDFSDFEKGEHSQDEFVNPFENESDVLSPRAPPPRLRNLSSSMSGSDQEGNGKRRSNNRYVEHLFFPSKDDDGNRKYKDSSNLNSNTTPNFFLSKNNNNNNGRPICFCDCGKPLQEGETCICEELADHLLHRGDGLSLMHLPSYDSSGGIDPRGRYDTNHLIF